MKIKRHAVSVEIGTAFLLALVSFLFHRPFFSAAVGISDNQYANANWPLFGLLSDEFRKGHWLPYTFRLGYGGTTFASLRALWQSIWFYFSPETAANHLQSAVVFNYGILPCFFTVLVYFLCRAYTGRLASILVALLLAVDFQSNLLDLYGSDYYFGYLVPSCIFLALRSQISNPFRELSPLGLLVSSAVTGWGLYVCRAAMLPVVAFWIPWEEVWPLIKNAFQTVSRSMLAVKGLFWIFVGSGLYLELFGGELGRVFGKRVYLDAGPNWNFAFVCFIVLIFPNLLRHRRAGDGKKIAWMALGFFLGFFPDLWAQMMVDHHFPGLNSNTYSQSIQKSLWIIGELPNRLRYLVSADPDRLSAVASVILAVLGGIALYRESIARPKLRAALALGALALFAFLRLRTGNTDAAPARYLLPILPVLYLGFAVLFERTRRTWKLNPTRGSLLATLAVAALFLIHLFSQLSAHARLSREILDSQQIDHSWQIVEDFRNTHVDLVLSDDYLISLQAMFLGQSQPAFGYLDEKVESGEIDEALQTAQKVGFLLASKEGPAPREIQARGKTWKLSEKMGEIGKFSLFLGIREGS